MSTGFTNVVLPARNIKSHAAVIAPRNLSRDCRDAAGAAKRERRLASRQPGRFAA